MPIMETTASGISVSTIRTIRIMAGMASRMIDAIEPYYPMFVEEPVLPENIEDNVITPVIRKFFEMTGLSAHIDVVVCQKIYPGSGIGSSAASSAAAAYGMNELFDCPLSDEQMVICAMEGENLASGGYHADNAAPAHPHPGL